MYVSCNLVNVCILNEQFTCKECHSQTPPHRHMLLIKTIRHTALIWVIMIFSTSCICIASSPGSLIHQDRQRRPTLNVERTANVNIVWLNSLVVWHAVSSHTSPASVSSTVSFTAFTGADLCKNVGGSKLPSLLVKWRKHRHRKQRRNLRYIIAVKINVDSC